jgi:hypothetical protein
MKESKEPKRGRRYSRAEIFKMFGGNMQSALPFKDGEAVAGCYDPKMNPDAPEVILVGVGVYKEYYSQRAAEQRTMLPIFLKRANAEYEFVGYYRAVRYSTDRTEIRRQNIGDRPENNIAGVLYFEEAKTV